MNTPESWAEFFDQVRCVRKLQKIYRQTLSPKFRRECTKQEDLLDLTIARIAEEALVAAEPIAESFAMEGGAA